VAPNGRQPGFQLLPNTPGNKVNPNQQRVVQPGRNMPGNQAGRGTGQTLHDNRNFGPGQFHPHLRPQNAFAYPPGKAPFGSGGFFHRILHGARGQQGYASLSFFRTKHGHASLRRDIGSGEFEMVVGDDLLDLGAPTNAQVVAVETLGDRQITVLQATSDDCPVDYIAVDVSAEPYQDWHMGDCHTPLSVWTNGQQLFAEAANQPDPQTWVYSGGQMYGPVPKSNLFRNSPPPPPPNPPLAMASAQAPSTPDDPNIAPPDADNPPQPPPPTHKTTRKTHPKPASPPPSTSTAQVIATKRFDPSVLQDNLAVAGGTVPYEKGVYAPE
jgi:hypothetical protein